MFFFIDNKSVAKAFGPDFLSKERVNLQVEYPFRHGFTFPSSIGSQIFCTTDGLDIPYVVFDNWDEYLGFMQSHEIKCVTFDYEWGQNCFAAGVAQERKAKEHCRKEANKLIIHKESCNAKVYLEFSDRIDFLAQNTVKSKVTKAVDPLNRNKQFHPGDKVSISGDDVLPGKTGVVKVAYRNLYIVVLDDDTGSMLPMPAAFLSNL